MNKDDINIFKSIKQLEDFINRPKASWHRKKGRYYFENSQFNFDINFENKIDILPSNVYFSNCIFKGKASFKGIIFQGEANFDNCTFKGQVDFTGCLFEKDVKFHNATFEKDCYFNESEFKGKVNAWKMTFIENVTFKWTNFRKKANLSELIAENGQVELYGVNFENNAYFYDSKIKRLDLKKSVIDKGLFFLGAEIKKAKRETSRIIKNEFLKQNNRIEALKYHQKEMSAYFIELGRNIIKPKSFYSFLKNIGDITILLINLISNGFGLWWFMAIVFLFVSTYLIFNWYLTNLNLTYTIDFWTYYPEFILPTHKFGFIDGTTPNNYANIIDFLGRIVSSFGIYQTVQAFRKFGRF